MVPFWIHSSRQELALDHPLSPNPLSDPSINLCYSDQSSMDQIDKSQHQFAISFLMEGPGISISSFAL